MKYRYNNVGKSSVQDKLYAILLPKKVRGKYWIEDSNLESMDLNRKILSYRRKENVWEMNAGRKLEIYSFEQVNPVSHLELEEGKYCLYNRVKTLALRRNL